jgi:hypothetical protein
VQSLVCNANRKYKETQTMPTQEQNVRAAIATAIPLTLNQNVPLAVLDDITANGAAAAGALSFASDTLKTLSAAHWFKIVHNEPAGTDFEFRTYFRQPSSDPDEELLVRMFALNQAGQFIVAPGSGTSIGSSVAHGGVVGTRGLSTSVFPASGQIITYFFRITLVDEGTLPNGPYVFLAFKL